MPLTNYTIVVDKNDNRGIWEGWGCSLAWWAHGVGGSSFQDLYADVLFTQKEVSILDQSVPGLGLSIVRYNVGGGGDGEKVDGFEEKVPAKYPWYKDIDGFQINPSSYDWDRDLNQRMVMLAARDRGATIEFFSNAPMWWMTAEKSSAGGRLLPDHRRDFAQYLATTAKYAQEHWGVKVASVSPFNEPSAGWWNYPKEQEGCNISRDVQAEILGYLRAELNSRELSAVQITASDENAMTEGIATYDFFKSHSNVADLVDKVNVHAYSGLEPWRDNAARKKLRATVGSKRIWMSEFGDGEGGGMPLAQTIIEDINHLRPSAWIYWQPIEPFSGWGLINAKYDHLADKTAKERAKPSWIYQKYFTFAQFTRFLRPGYSILGSSDDNSVVAYDTKDQKLVLITVNYGSAQKISCDLSGFSKVGSSGTLTTTNTVGPKRLASSALSVINKTISFDAEPNSVHSVVINSVKL